MVNTNVGRTLALIAVTLIAAAMAAAARPQSAPAYFLRYPPLGAAVIPVTGTGFSSSLNVGPYAISTHTTEMIVTGSPSSCVAHLQGSNDDPAITDAHSNWSDLSGPQDCTTITMFHVVTKPVQKIRYWLQTFSGGTAPTFAWVYYGTRG